MVASKGPVTSHQTAVQDALDAAVRGIAALAAVDEVLQLIVDRVRPLVGAEYAALGIVDANGRIERFITSGMDSATRERIGHLPEGHGLLGLIIRENRSFRIPDINSDPHRHGFPPNHPPMTSFLGVPVTFGTETVGRLYLTNKVGASEFTEEDQNLVERFALHAGIAMANARLHERLRGLAIVEERERISKDLHDGIIQNLYAVGLSLEDVADELGDGHSDMARRVERAIDAIHLAIKDIRNFIFGLRPGLLEGVSLATGLNAIVEEGRHNTIIEIDLELPESLAEPPPVVTSHLLAIVSESLSNVIRHSRATVARVAARSSDAPVLHWELTIEDNGVGFDPGGVAPLGHQGLANTRDRATEVGGVLRVESEPGVGTRVVVRVPDTADGRSNGR
jgi:signal transduction histidine kinase